LDEQEIHKKISMHKFRKLKPRLMIPVSDQPPAPTPIDAEIARNNGTSVAIEATSENMQASKTAYTPSLSEIIDQRTRENGRLRQELEHKQSKLGASVDLLEELRMIVERLQQAINNYQMRTTLQLGEAR
jgi:hypothetical protein